MYICLRIYAYIYICMNETKRGRGGGAELARQSKHPKQRMRGNSQMLYNMVEHIQNRFCSADAPPTWTKIVLALGEWSRAGVVGRDVLLHGKSPEAP